MPISEYKDSLTLLRSKQQSHYLRGRMKYQSHFLLASVIKENLVAWLFMPFFFFFLPLKKGNLNGMKGRKILKIKIKGKFPTNYIVFCFQKRNSNQFSSSPLYLMLNSSRTTTAKRDVKHIALCLEWGKLLPYYCYCYEY